MPNECPMYSHPSSITYYIVSCGASGERLSKWNIYKRARPATTRAPKPEPTLAPELAWTGTEVVGPAGALVPDGAAAPGTVVAGRAGVGVGGLAGTGVTDTIGIVAVPDVVTG